MNVTPFPAARKEKVGLKFWMNRVLESISTLDNDLPAEPVHNLRVALRRCIAIADRMRDLDPEGPWKPMRRKARKLFSGLGASRDSQVLSEWMKRIDPDNEASSAAVRAVLNESSESDQRVARREIEKFDRKQWREWSRELSARFRHAAADRAVCECLTMEVFEAVHHRHRLSQKNPSPFAFHRLRVEVKTFRYVVENFLPNLYPGWVADLKFLQDVLGEIHDLDVLSRLITHNRVLVGEESRAWWERKLGAERSSRIQQYRQKMAESQSPLVTWREVLPGERERRAVGLAKLSAWAYFLTPNFARTRRIAKFALQLHDGFSNCGLIGRGSELEERAILQSAALLQDVGRSRKAKAYHKESYRMIRGLTPPVGWSRRDLALAASIARFHRRALPRPDHQILESFAPAVRHAVLREVAFLRLANAFGGNAHKSVRRLDVEKFDNVVIVRADGYSEGDRFTSKLSVAVHLLESVFLHPVRILPRGARMPEPKSILQPASAFAVRT
jgi:CHAD domain-containing protein